MVGEVVLAVVGSTEVVVGDKLVVVGGSELVAVGGLVAGVDVDDLEQPVPATSSDNNTSAITVTLGILYIIVSSPKYIYIEASVWHFSENSYTLCSNAVQHFGTTPR